MIPMETVQNHKQAAVHFLELIINRQIDQAFERYVEMSGTHHNPYYPAGFPALRQGMIDNDEQVPHKEMFVKNVIGEGELVTVHFRLVLQAYELAVVYIFRFHNQKIVELWDIGMAAPPDAPNKDNLF